MPAEPNKVSRLRVQLIAAAFARLVINTAHRMVYPFLPAISRGLNVPPESVAALLSIRAALGMTSPAFGPIPDRLGRRNAMFIGLAVFSGGLLLVGFFPSYPTLFAAIVGITVSKFVFDPALQAYLGDRTSYSQRGLVIAFTELGWSGAVLAGIPLAGLLIARGGWNAPFAPLAALGALAAVGLWLVVPRDERRANHEGPGMLNMWALIWRSPAVIAAMSVAMLASAANENLNVVYGEWMEKSFGLSVVALGLTTTVIGVAELAGEGLVMGLADRLGKRRAVALGLGAGAAAYGALPLVGSNIQFALVTLFFIFISFEFAIVSSIPLINELLPEARGTVMSTSVAFHAAGRMIGALLGGYLFRFGFAWNGAAAVLLNLACIPIILWWVRERK